jgi:hypothetical protein
MIFITFIDKETRVSYNLLVDSLAVVSATEENHVAFVIQDITYGNEPIHIEWPL